MWCADQWKDYELLDTSDGERLERWGKYILIRPDPQIIWKIPPSILHGRRLTLSIVAHPMAAVVGFGIRFPINGISITEI
jgi:hypothetical protein